jgi:hypothetical protein
MNKKRRRAKAIARDGSLGNRSINPRGALVGLKCEGMDGRPSSVHPSAARFASAIFALIALLQLVRALSGWEITINGAMVPVWPSWVACGVGVVLAWLGFTASRVTAVESMTERDVVSRVSNLTAGSQPRASQSGRVRHMLRVNYVRPEQMPSHQRDFPRKEAELPSAAGSGGLGLMVACYLIAMFAGILLLDYLTAPRLPNIAVIAQLDR